MKKWKVEQDPTSYAAKRYEWLIRFIGMSLRGDYEYSVGVIDSLLSHIFSSSDAAYIDENQITANEEAFKYKECIKLKFATFKKLAKALKVSTEELLSMADPNIWSNIAIFLSHYPDILDSLGVCSFEFSQEYFQYRTWLIVLF